MLSLIHMLQEAVAGESLDVAPLTPTNRFLVKQGFLYIGLGLLHLLVPGVVGQLLFMPISEVEEPLYRVVGVSLLVIGYFYIQSARSNTYFFVTTTILDRLTFVPAGIIICYLGGAPVQICAAFGILDPVLALLTYRSWIQNEDYTANKFD